MADKVVERLNSLLADTVVFYYKLHNAHWYVRGPRFFQLHEEFEKLYTTWHEHLDALAERVIALDGNPVPSLGRALELATLKERTEVLEADALVRDTVSDLLALHGYCLEIIKTAEPAGDRTTANLLDDINDGIEKAVWMLRAYNAG